MFRNRKLLLWAGMLVLLAGLVTLPAAAGEIRKGGGQSTFVSPDEAVQALVGAVRGGDDAKLTAIFGPESEELIRSGDPVADRNGRERFLKTFAEKYALENRDENLAVLHIGLVDYPFPIPLVRREGGWSFDTRVGKEEILNRRIGRNELGTIEVLQAYTGAQRDYACRTSQGGDEVGQFAQKLISSPGRRDGLYWPSGAEGEESPFGPLIATATEAGYDGTLGGGTAEPFQGYYFKILTGQGPHASGGAFDYLVNGKMLLGFGMVAYPARYGSTGVKTFIVSQEGVIFEKDLGEQSGTAAAMTTYDPDATWRRCEVPPQE